MRGWLALTAIALLAHVPATANAQGTQGQERSGPPTIPVSVAPVTRADVPTFINGLGTVLALRTVQLRSQVDGVLQSVPVTEGQDVRQGDVLAIVDPRPYQAAVDAAMAKKHQDEALLTAARADLERYTMLNAKQVTSQQQLEAMRAKAGQLTAAIALDQAQIDTAKLNLTWCYIKAPFDGRVGLRVTDPGNFVRAAEVTSLMPLSQLRPIAVTFTVPQDNLPAIQKALAAGNAPVVASSGDGKTTLDRGVLLTIDNAIDAATGTIKLKATFPNADYRLWPGQFVNTRLQLGTSGGVLTVPSTAVRHGQDQMYVYVVEANKTVSRHVVEVARDDGVTAIIAKGLEEGQLAVTDGQSRLQNGTHVTVINAAPKEAANPPRQGG